jgi:MoxR-like ATPase
MTNIMLADEINRASPKTQSSLLEAMEENAVTVDGVTYKLASPFFVIATQNPSGYVGTYPLPEAQLDRFSIRMSMGYPAEDEEFRIITDRKTENPVSKVVSAATKEEIAAMIGECAGIKIDPEVSRYIVSLVRATRQSDKIALGASPRATIALMKVSQAYAFVHGRDFVMPEDVSAVYLPVIAHRLTLSKEARMNSEKADDVLRELLQSVKVPFRADR